MIEPILFPYLTMPVRLEFGDKKNKTICWFSCNEHLQSYLNRYKLDKRTIKIDYRDEPPITSERNKRSVVQKPKSKSDGGASTVRKRNTSVDTARNTSRTSKHKK